MPLLLTKLQIDIEVVMRKNPINFVGLILVMLGVILDLILNWKNHIKIIDIKVTKKLSLTHRA